MRVQIPSRAPEHILNYSIQTPVLGQGLVMVNYFTIVRIVEWIVREMRTAGSCVDAMFSVVNIVEMKS